MTNDPALTRTQFTLSQASRITGKSRTTLRTYLKRGKLSCVEGHDAQRLIDGAELVRCFGNNLDFGLADPGSKGRGGGGGSKPDNADQSGSEHFELVRRQLDREIEERDKERERFERQLGEMHEVLKRTQEGHERAMRLLEDRSGQQRDWEAPLKRLEAQVATQEQEQRELKEQARRRIARLQRELKEERSKTLWQRVFARGGRRGLGQTAPPGPTDKKTG